MPNRNNRHPFDIGKKFEAAKSFTFNGRRYSRGDAFPWRRIACSRRKLLQLYEGRFVNVTPEYDKEAEKERKAEVKKSAPKKTAKSSGRKKASGGGNSAKPAGGKKKSASKPKKADETLPPEELPTEPQGESKSEEPLDL